MGRLELVIESENVSIYSPKYNGESLTEFEKFMANNKELSDISLRKDFQSIIAAIDKMINSCGARENLFRLEGGKIKAIPLCISYRRRGIGTLRLYCIRLSNRILIIGNGGIKCVPRYEDDPILLEIVNRLRKIEYLIHCEARKRHSDYDDFETMKIIIESINVE